MNDWTSGYVTGVDYTFGYYPELNPHRARFALLCSGIQPPRVNRACELGFGQGVCVNLHASASRTQWVGTDFNPAQALFAQDLARASGADVRLHDQSFEQFCAREDLPPFDYIALHGIWSWISQDNRKRIIDLVNRKLDVGGVLYVSYNAMPGWAAPGPIQHLMSQHADKMSATGSGLLSQVDQAIAFLERLLQTNPAYLRSVPGLEKRVAKIKEHNRNYVAHEYFNQEWAPMYFADMAGELSAAKLSFACSAHYTDLVPAVNLSAEHQKLLADISDPEFRETVRDYMTNTQFRRDFWIKGARRLSAAEQLRMIKATSVILVTPSADVKFKIVGALGEVGMNEKMHAGVIEQLADHQPRSIGELEKRLSGSMSFPQVLRALLLLIAKNDVALVQGDAEQSDSLSSSRRLNKYLLQRTRDSSEISYLASPVTGGGVHVSYVHQLFLLSLMDGREGPDELASTAWRLMQAAGRKVNKDGKPMETPEDNLKELGTMAKQFLNKRLPGLRSLGIA